MGNFMVLNLFLALLLNSFNSEELKTRKEVFLNVNEFDVITHANKNKKKRNLFFLLSYLWILSRSFTFDFGYVFFSFCCVRFSTVFTPSRSLPSCALIVVVIDVVIVVVVCWHCCCARAQTVTFL